MGVTNMSKFVSVQYLNKALSGMFIDDYTKIDPRFEPFKGREYSYKTDLDLRVGNVVLAPVGNGHGVARISNDNVSESQIDERIMPLLKSITQIYEPPKTQEVITMSVDEL
jgi:hypothetical protein